MSLGVAEPDLDVPDCDGPDGDVPERAGRTVTVFTARVVETRGLLARIAVQLNPYDVRELALSLEDNQLQVTVEGNGFDANRVAARLDKIVGVLDVTYS
ncbi:hypothetical protein EV643_102505 [Kribbella sp. VKM Ac-2527]|uniref:ACT domain-containing protein n=1 Tax=Kribbella caucasensis TaxID=2512215 RepID=A0A4R6KPP4_9ACTN|nr:hypothetical protein [Kribbella sp. VKM Ac-2527]TDO52665.1 hypothetical protein EV643_102505 [Kribbella sp. VKM Ac-2527]